MNIHICRQSKHVQDLCVLCNVRYAHKSVAAAGLTRSEVEDISYHTEEAAKRGTGWDVRPWSGSKHLNSFIPMPGDTARQEEPIALDKPKCHICEILVHLRCLHSAGRYLQERVSGMSATHQAATDQAGYTSHSTHKNTRYLWFKQLSPNLYIDFVASRIALNSIASIASETLAFTHLHVGVLFQSWILPQ